MYRISHMPMRLEKAKRNIQNFRTLVARESRPKNGAKNTRMIEATVTHTYGSIRRRRMNHVSSPMLPHQITRYSPNVRYPQNAVNAEHSLPMSWKCVSFIRPFAPLRDESQTRASTANSISAHSQ